MPMPMPTARSLTDIEIRIELRSRRAGDTGMARDIIERPIMRTNPNIIIIDAFLELGIVDFCEPALFALVEIFIEVWVIAGAFWWGCFVALAFLEDVVEAGSDWAFHAFFHCRVVIGIGGAWLAFHCLCVYVETVLASHAWACIAVEYWVTRTGLAFLSARHIHVSGPTELAFHGRRIEILGSRIITSPTRTQSRVILAIFRTCGA